jgi:hypothetical protein
MVAAIQVQGSLIAGSYFQIDTAGTSLVQSLQAATQ